MREVGDQIKALDDELRGVEETLESFTTQHSKYPT